LLHWTVNMTEILTPSIIPPEGHTCQIGRQLFEIRMLGDTIYVGNLCLKTLEICTTCGSLRGVGRNLPTVEHVNRGPTCGGCSWIPIVESDSGCEKLLWCKWCGVLRPVNEPLLPESGLPYPGLRPSPGSGVKMERVPYPLPAFKKIEAKHMFQGD
jgi:hypothetical protein